MNRCSHENGVAYKNCDLFLAFLRRFSTKYRYALYDYLGSWRILYATIYSIFVLSTYFLDSFPLALGGIERLWSVLSASRLC